MLKEDLDKVLNALRFGDYDQIGGSVRRIESWDEGTIFDPSSIKYGYCAIGVAACALNYDEKRHWSTLAVAKFLNSIGLDFGILNGMELMNDVEKKTFPEIADWLELEMKERGYIND